MKLSVVILIVFAVLMVDSQAQRHRSIDNYLRAEEGEETEERDSSKLPIPIITEKVATAIAKGSDMLTAALQEAAANESFDKTGALTILRSEFIQVNQYLNILFTQLTYTVSKRIIARAIKSKDPLVDLISKVNRGVKEVKYNTGLEGIIKPSELSDIINALEDLSQKLANLSVFNPKVRSPSVLFEEEEENNEEEEEENLNQGLDLQTVLSEWSTAIEEIAKTVQVLAKALQKAITSRILAITVQKSVHKSLSISGSYLSMVSTQLNDALENVRIKLGMSSQKSVTQVNQAYSSITSNPTKWHQSLLNKLYAFLGSYSGFTQQLYLSKVASSVKTAELEIAAEIITQTRTSGLKIAEVTTYISDTAAASANPRASSECSIKQLMKLNPSSLNSLAQCANMEANNIKALPTQGQQQLTVAKDNAISIVSQLTVCNGGSDNCYKQFLTVFDSMKTTAKKDLKAAGTQVESSLQAISQRIKDCLKVAAGEIEKTADKAKKDFDFCLKF